MRLPDDILTGAVDRPVIWDSLGAYENKFSFSIIPWAGVCHHLTLIHSI
jgi:hypothetical protein